MLQQSGQQLQQSPSVLLLLGREEAALIVFKSKLVLKYSHTSPAILACSLVGSHITAGRVCRAACRILPYPSACRLKKPYLSSLVKE